MSAPVSPGRGNSSGDLRAILAAIAPGAHEVVTAAIQHGREEHRHRSSARLAGAALEALAAEGYVVVQLPGLEGLENFGLRAAPNRVVDDFDGYTHTPEKANALGLALIQASLLAVSGAEK